MEIYGALYTDKCKKISILYVEMKTIANFQLWMESFFFYFATLLYILDLHYRNPAAEQPIIITNTETHVQCNEAMVREIQIF